MNRSKFLEYRYLNPKVSDRDIIDVMILEGSADPLLIDCVNFGIDPAAGPEKLIRSKIQKAKAIAAKDKRHNQENCRGKVWESCYGNEKMYPVAHNPYVLRRYQNLVKIEKELMLKEELKQKKLKRDPEVLGPVAGSNIREALLAQANAVRNGGNQSYKDK